MPLPLATLASSMSLYALEFFQDALVLFQSGWVLSLQFSLECRRMLWWDTPEVGCWRSTWFSYSCRSLGCCHSARPERRANRWLVRFHLCSTP